jgi:hypothetical protein
MAKFVRPNENKILIVSTDKNLTSIIKQHLLTSKKNIEVHTASTNSEIIKKMFGHKFDNIIVSRKNEDLVKGIKNYDEKIRFIEKEDELKENLKNIINSYIK